MAATFPRRKGRGPYRTRLTGRLAFFLLFQMDTLEGGDGDSRELVNRRTALPCPLIGETVKRSLDRFPQFFGRLAADRHADKAGRHDVAAARAAFGRRVHAAE